MTKFTASTVKGSGYKLIREEGRPYYVIVKDNVQRPLSPQIGHLYKDASTGLYKVTIGLNTVTKEDFNAAKSYIKEQIAA